MRRTRSSRNKSEGAEDTGVNTAWQWEGDDGQWEAYAPEVCAQINAAVQAGRKTLTLKLGPGYVVDLAKMTQTNTTTKYRRNIRRSDAADEGEGESSVKIKKEEEEEAAEEEASNPKKRRGQARAKKQETNKEIKQEVKEEEEEEEDTPATKKGRSQGKAKKTEPAESKEVVKTLVMRGKAPVDLECKAKLGKAHVYSEGNDVYDVMLNQTNLQFNNNKYYLIQLLQDDQAKSYSVWMRWGRVGKVGQNSLVACGSDLAQAKDVFTKKFLDKTKNDWSCRASFQKVPGKYDMVFMDYSANDKEEEEEVVGSDPAPVEKKPSKLDGKLQALMELICDIKAMEECVLEMKFDTKKAPLGKLTAEQIRVGYASLKRIEDCLKRKGSNKELLEACNQFYTRIPHDFGLRTPPVIRTEEELKEKIALLEALSDIQIAVKMVQSSAASDEHPVDKHYHALKCHLHPLDPAGHEFQVIEKYLQSTHATTHSDYTMKVLDVFSVEREGEKSRFQSSLHNRMLLWHGSRLSNWVGILSQGLRVAPPEAPVTGYMFGKGIYFADMSSKSANYCFTTPKNNTGLLLLSEVALGECNELVDASYDADKLPSGKHSTKGLGQTAPDPKNSTTLDGATVPNGPGLKTGLGRGGGYSLLYNEFVVYDPAQIRMKYLLKVQFNHAALW
ncbi:poly [ADP-ribose] polymerase 2 [Trichomycterus rosablanca]|uniref:poly [ADP-ribose] polymerase 2 n=1 Tax=Trichomycterus rosablanca TaxID=2290929 RepID=UPI002F34FB53